MTDQIDVVAVNRGEARALLSDGTMLPVTDWLDDEGDETDPSSAVKAIAGECGFWITFSLDGFETGGMQ